jgi:hypothetical protein
VLDRRAWESQLSARVIEGAPDADRVYGYAVVSDLARHYAYSDVVYLAITGELPDDRSAQLFRTALTASAPASVRDASAHGAVLARVSAASVATSIAVGAIGAAAEVQDLVERHAELFGWFAARTAETPPAFRAESDDWVGALLESVRGIDPQPDLPRPDMTRDAAVIALMCAAGVRTPDQVMAALLMSRLCGISAEVLATGPQHFWNYPVQVPATRYVEETPA